ncbi:MAG: GFA family protein [Massilia sp.]
MPTLTTGGCACVDIRFEIPGEPVFQNHCQCTDCQKRSGTEHSSYITFRARKTMQISGAPSHWDITADSGHVKTHAFCHRCGTPLYLTFASMPELVAVYAGRWMSRRSLCQGF